MLKVLVKSLFVGSRSSRQLLGLLSLGDPQSRSFLSRNARPAGAQVNLLDVNNYSLMRLAGLLGYVLQLDLLVENLHVFHVIPNTHVEKRADRNET